MKYASKISRFKCAMSKFQSGNSSKLYANGKKINICYLIDQLNS